MEHRIRRWASAAQCYDHILEREVDVGRFDEVMFLQEAVAVLRPVRSIRETVAPDTPDILISTCDP
eukprot:CAMPEP_0167829804 /NCGR_PEP_ID=MMETSP0112_2-20121227/12456_1 /TAXON_ID=91324 /ORGANISM="Lotharella globosa, Strain CCCM811" /LENGTH=65 /DNA_ID=CAMNT_0007733725 /DNA_START=508 /DNA_END=701 /DNA_ORIENTATION=+